MGKAKEKGATCPLSFRSLVRDLFQYLCTLQQSHQFSRPLQRFTMLAAQFECDSLSKSAGNGRTINHGMSPMVSTASDGFLDHKSTHYANHIIVSFVNAMGVLLNGHSLTLSRLGGAFPRLKRGAPC